MDYHSIIYKKEQGVATIILNRPRALNALNAEMIFTGKAFEASEAERIGLINRVVPTQDLIKSAQELADKLARGPSLAIGLAKEAIWRNLSQNLDSALNFEAQSQKACLDSEDHREAVKAFLEKCDPHFRGK